MQNFRVLIKQDRSVPIETLATLSEANYAQLLSTLRNTYKAPVWINVYGDGSELNFEEVDGALRFSQPYARKHVRYVDLFVRRTGNQVLLEWNPPDQQEQCGAGILAIGLTFFFLTLLLVLLLTRNPLAISMHAMFLVVFWGAARIDKKMRAAVTERVRAAVTGSTAH
jgi:hypothetical protein